MLYEAAIVIVTDQRWVLIAPLVVHEENSARDAGRCATRDEVIAQELKAVTAANEVVGHAAERPKHARRDEARDLRLDRRRHRRIVVAADAYVSDRRTLLVGKRETGFVGQKRPRVAAESQIEAFAAQPVRWIYLIGTALKVPVLGW